MALTELSYAPGDDDASDELPPGTVLFHGQYTITRHVNSGGFGITYLAKDNLGRDAIIKECFVSTFCRRHRARVSARSAHNKEDLKKVVRYFLKEAHSLAKMNHPNVVGVHQVFEDNDTAYMVLDYVRGKDLLDTIEEGNPGIGPEGIVEITRKLVSAMMYVHELDVLHGDISPDNILLTQAGEPIIIDFGAARKCVADTNNKYTGLNVVKDGYSPHELYFAGGNYGPWSDIYALAATIFHLVSRTVPTGSQSRVAAVAERRPDPCQPLAGRFQGYPVGFLESIDKAMSAMPAARYQSAGDWLEMLNGSQNYEDTNVKLLQKALRIPESVRPRKTPPSPVPESEPTGPISQQALKGYDMAINLTELQEIAGFIGGCLVDSETGFMLASEGGANFDLEAASAANTEVVKAKLKAIALLGLKDNIEDILITLGKQLHLIRPLEKTPTVFLYVALDRKAANLGMARVQVKKVEQSVSL